MVRIVTEEEKEDAYREKQAKDPKKGILSADDGLRMTKSLSTFGNRSRRSRSSLRVGIVRVLGQKEKSKKKSLQIYLQCCVVWTCGFCARSDVLNAVQTGCYASTVCATIHGAAENDTLWDCEGINSFSKSKRISIKHAGQRSACTLSILHPTKSENGIPLASYSNESNCRRRTLSFPLFSCRFLNPLTQNALERRDGYWKKEKWRDFRKVVIWIIKRIIIWFKGYPCKFSVLFRFIWMKGIHFHDRYEFIYPYCIHRNRKLLVD